MVRETGHCLLSIILCSKNSTTCVEVFLPVFYSNDQLMCIGGRRNGYSQISGEISTRAGLPFRKTKPIGLGFVPAFRVFVFNFCSFSILLVLRWGNMRVIKAREV